ncbi:MAG: WD40/YVTN/BNR-like repeat-containing protein [Acidimicrobiales bacterium]
MHDAGTASETGVVSIAVEPTPSRSPSPALSITTADLPAGTAGEPYPPVSLAAAGGSPPYTWTADEIPAGLVVSPSGSISGSPSVLGTATLRATVHDSKGATATSVFSVVIVPRFLIINPVTLPTGAVGQAYPPTTFTAAGTGPFTWSATGLPAGLSLSAAGVLTGTPTVAGSSNPLVMVQDSTSGVLTEHFPLPVASVYAEAASYFGSAAMLRGVSCPTPADCVAVGNTFDLSAAILATTDGGASWHDQVVPVGTSDLYGVSCSSPAVCTAVGTTLSGTAGIVATVDGGASWSTQTAPPGATVLDAVSCPTISACVAVGDVKGVPTPSAVIVATTEGGATWVAQTVPAGTETLTAVSCVSALACVVVGSSSTSGAILATTDGGRAWAPEAVPAGIGSLSGVSCLSALGCHAVGETTVTTGGAPELTGEFLTTLDGGTTWTGTDTFPYLQSPQAVSCTDLSDCTVVGNVSLEAAAVVTTDGGASWAVHAVFPGVLELAGVACSSAPACTAVGSSAATSATIVATTVGGTWTGEAVPAGIAILAAVSCPSVSDCTVVGYSRRSPVRRSWPRATAGRRGTPRQCRPASPSSARCRARPWKTAPLWAPQVALR